MKDIKLLYFEGCPNVEQARSNLRSALDRVGFAARWDEIDLQGPECPASWGGFPSPTVLINGADVISGARCQSGTSSCRFGGAPRVEQIVNALKNPPGLSSLAALPAAMAGLLPATFCPACYPALAGLLGALGVGAYADHMLLPLTVVLLVIALIGLGFEARRNGDYRSLIMGVLGAGMMFLGQFTLASPPLKWVGIALLLAASLWNISPRLKRNAEGCSACAEGR